MIDLIIIELTDFDTQVWNKHPKLRFNSLTSDDSGEKIGSSKAYYNGLEFTKEPKGKVKIKGSIHKYYNNGLHNGDRFTFDDFEKAVSQLSEFGVVPEKAILRGFEIGLNLDTSKSKINTKTFLDSILYCGGIERSDMEINGKLGYGSKFKTANVTYKFYDKMEQACLQSEMLRIETKFTKMRAVENYGITCLSDLLDRTKLANLISDKYLKFIDKTIFFEWNQIKTTRKLPTKYKSKFKDLRNPDWWIKDQRNNTNRQRNKKLLEDLIKTYAKRDIKNILKGMILLEISAFARTKKCYEYTEFEPLKKWNCLDENAQKDVTNTPRIVRCDNHDQREGKEKKKYCLTCGKEITGQKSDSKYCNDQRKCRDKAYNLKVSEKRQAKRSQKEKEIINLIKDLGNEFNLIRTTNPNRKKIKGVPSRKTSIIATIGGKKRYYHGADARFFLNEFDKKTKTEVLTQCPYDTRLEHAQ
ncbi:hypothetical protein [Labilibaculum sp.]|uniref:hypothetical protein n=1 Tax=Labilibaculum sp. TaxID=2060723 RepID=UPI002AA8832A|nr:hypothetical protein [Labilibaculum sp.]